MTLLRTKEIRTMRPEDRELKLKELNDELMHERGVAAMGGAPASPGKLRAIRMNIARILTIQREMELAGEAGTVPAKKEKSGTRAAKGRREKAAAEDEDRTGEDQEEKT